MMEYSLVRVADVLGLRFSGDNPSMTGVSIDSRTLKVGNLFFAIKGDTFDGHDFVLAAKKQGAIAAVVSRHLDIDIPQFVVKDTTQALGQLAADYRDRSHIPIIAVTGSSGKTTTKNLIAAILQAAYGKDKVLFSPGGYNNHWGMPLTLTRLTDQHRVGVLEMGMNHFGELSNLSKIAKPNVTVITNVGPCHLQGVLDVAGVARAKAEIFTGLSLQGTAVLPQDDSYFKYWQDQLHGHRIISFGLHSPAEVTAKNIHITPKASFTLVSPYGEVEIQLQLLGKHNVMNALAAVAATMVLDIDLESIKEGLESVTAMPGRMRQLLLSGGVRLFDDAYNANPLSVSAAIDMISLCDGKTVLVLGDMKELGDKAQEFHVEIGQYAKAQGIDYLFAVGELTPLTCQAFGERAQHFSSHSDLIEALQPVLTAGVIVLVKGSLSMRMQSIVSTLLDQAEMEASIL